MSKLILGKIDVLKIDKERLFKGKKGTYCDIAIWILDEPDRYGNEVSIQQNTKKGENKIYLGSGKFFVQSNDKPPEQEETDDLPF